METPGSSARLLEKIRVGTSGWSYEDWAGVFYPEGTKPADYLAAYATSLSTVEVDSTFYSIPSARTVEGWRERTPPGFLFAPKVPGSVTHGALGERPRVEKVLVDAEGALDAFIERILPLGPKLGPVVLQFPYFRVKELSPAEFLPRLEATLRRIPTDVRVAVEVRNKGWIRRDLLALLEAHRAAAVLIDHPYMPGPEEQLALGMVTTDFTYVRLLGDRHAIEEKTRRWDRVIEDRSDRVERWSQVILDIASRPAVRAAYAFANNHYAGHAPATCRDLAARIGLPAPGGGDAV